MKNKYAQSKTDAFSQVVKSSKLEPILLKTDDGKEYVNKNFNIILNNHNNTRCSRNTALGAVFAQKFRRTIRNLLKKPIFLKENADWLSANPCVIKLYNNTINRSTKMKPIDASLKMNEKEVYPSLHDKRKNLTQNLN